MKRHGSSNIARLRIAVARAKLEALENRRLFATIVWANAQGGDFNTAANWAGGVVPGRGDDAIINLNATFVVSLTAPASVHTLTIGANNQTSQQFVSVQNTTLTLAAGGSTVPGGELQMSTADLAGAGTFVNSGAAVFTSTMANIPVVNFGSLTDDVTVAFNGGLGSEANSTFQIIGATLIAGGFANRGGLIMNGAPGTTAQLSFNGGGSLVNAAGATFTVTSTAADQVVVTGDFLNQGMIQLQGPATVNGSFSAAASGTLSLVFAGNPAQLVVNGAAMFGGALTVVDPLQTTVGQSFSLVKFASASGSFSSVSSTLFGTPSRSVSLSQTATELLATVVVGGQGGVTLTQNGGTLSGVGATGSNAISITTDGTTLTVTGNGTPQTFPLSSVTALSFDLGMGTDSLTLGKNIPPALIRGGSGNDTILSNSLADDTIVAGGGNDSIKAGRGFTRIIGGRGNDTIRGGKGTARIKVGNGDSVVVGGKGSVTVHGGRGHDTVASGSAPSKFVAGKGATFLANGGGSGDTLVGGQGGISFAQANAADSINNIFEVYDPTPPAGTAARVADVVAAAQGAAAQVAAAQGAAAQIAGTVVAVVNGRLKVVGPAGASAISVVPDGLGNLNVTADGLLAGTIPLLGLTGVRVIAGAGVNDTLSVDPSIALPATVRGGGGNDSLAGGGGNNVLVGGGGNDTLVGGGGLTRGTNLLVPGFRQKFTGAPAGNPLLVGGPAGTVSIADFRTRTDPLFLTNDGQAHSGDRAAGEAATIMPSVQNIFAGAADDTVVSTTANSFLTSGIGHDSLASGGDANILVAGPNGGGTLASAGMHNALFLRNGQRDTYRGDLSTDILQLDVGLDTIG